MADGTVIKPDIDDGFTVSEAKFCSGGFAAEVIDTDGIFTGFGFFDETGKHFGGTDDRGVLDDDHLLDLPVLYTDEQSSVYSAKGQKLVDVPPGSLSRVGDTLLVNEAKSREFPEWRHYQLPGGGAEGPVCDFPMHRLFGYHGTALVFEVTNRNAGLPATWTPASGSGSCPPR
ncbi:hypothetical protein [Mycolicibacterium sp.]|uniref:hypothetical protein n=1 Tax=Mycolicibacterium sp. TaxID=2320850 RepID=UPI003D13DC88